MLPILFFTLLSNIGEPISPKVAAIESKARLHPPKRSPWHGTSEGAMKVTLWNGTGAPEKLKVDASFNGGKARDYYWFQVGKVAYGTQARFSNGEAVERRMTFSAGKLTKVQERRAPSETALGAAAFRELPAAEVATLDQSVATLVKECLNAPGIKDRKAMVKAVENDRVVLETAPGVDAWVNRRSGDLISPALVGKRVTYDFTAVDMDGQETDYLNAISPIDKGSASAAKKSTARKATKKRARARAKQ